MFQEALKGAFIYSENNTIIENSVVKNNTNTSTTSNSKDGAISHNLNISQNRGTIIQTNADGNGEYIYNAYLNTQ